MKPVVLTLLLVGGSLFISAQNYIPFPDSGAVWVNTHYSIHLNQWIPEGVEFTLENVEYFCVNGQDTVIDNQEYTQLFYCGDEYFGAVRDSSGLVTFVPKDETEEYTLYDFSFDEAGVVENVISYYDASFNSFDVMTISVGPVLTSYIGGRTRRIRSAPAFNWIEGIGSQTGLFKEGWANVSSFSNELECFSMNDSILYPNPSLNACSFTVGLDEETTKDPEISFYPNPTNDFVSIEFGENQTGRLIISNTFGQEVESSEVYNSRAEQIPVSGQRGIYFLRFIRDDGTEQNFKVLKN
ncbi:MAG: T9SS type A sorting domain-containing protein [Flavobacteriales bacterium]